MKIYQFIKYNQNTSINHIKYNDNNNVIICFDFEDGIQNTLDKDKTAKLKEKHRDYFVSLATKLDNNLKIGVRLNAKDSSEFRKDIFKIKGININSIFLPKIENAEDLNDIVSQLDENKINYKEIIPIIENKNGLNNIDKIIKVSNIGNIAFGHCDYNLSLNIFPFFHQENFEYWKWVDKIVTITNENDICFINSPFLSLKNLDFFGSMIEHLKKITNDNFGQISLSNTHTKICIDSSVFKKQKFNKLLDNRHQLYPTQEFAEELIYNYEKYNTGMGLTKLKDRIISFQEYISAKKYINSNKPNKVKLAFVGGCFPVQHNILYEDIFLTKTKHNIETLLNLELQIDIIRYERLSNVIDKIREHNFTKKIDTLIFSIRPEPYLRIIKFYYKYINNKGKLKHSLNLPLFNVVNSEKYDILILGRRYDYRKKIKNTKFHKFLINSNYLIGKLLGNKFYALKKYVELIEKIEKYCNDNRINLILLGPNLRANTKFEPYFCKELDNKMRKFYPKIQYINGLDNNYRGEKLFHKNGIHVNELYHNMIAKRLVTVLKELLK